MPIQYNPTNWYWIVGGDTTRVFSSAVPDYVPATDPTYQAWLATGKRPYSIDTEYNLSMVLDPDNIIGPVVLPKYVDREAYRRISTKFVFRVHPIQMRDEDVDGIRRNDQINICAQAVLANKAIAEGAQVGDYNWCGDLQPFVWRTADNQNVPMDAHDMSALAEAAARWKREHVWAAGLLKTANPTPRDFADDKYWPSAV